MHKAPDYLSTINLLPENYGQNVVYPATTLQTCIVHLIRNSFGCASWKDRKALVAAQADLAGAARYPRRLEQCRQQLEIAMNPFAILYEDRFIKSLCNVSIDFPTVPSPAVRGRLDELEKES